MWVYQRKYVRADSDQVGWLSVRWLSGRFVRVIRDHDKTVVGDKCINNAASKMRMGDRYGTT